MAAAARSVLAWFAPLLPSSRPTTRRQQLDAAPPSPQHPRCFLPIVQPCLLHRSVWPSLKREKDCLLVACLPSPLRSSTESNASASTKLYVSGLSFRTTEDNLRTAFQSFGQLLEVNLVMDRIANRSRGFAFLRYATEDEAMAAIEGMHGKFLDGRVIFVEVSKPRTQRPQRDTRQTSRQF